MELKCSPHTQPNWPNEYGTHGYLTWLHKNTRKVMKRGTHRHMHCEMNVDLANKTSEIGDLILLKNKKNRGI